MWTRKDIEQLYQRHGYAVHRRCRRFVDNEAEAQDLTQEVFLKALESPDRFRGQSSVATYLFAVATHLCLNRLRNRRARNEAWQEQVARHLSDQRSSSDLDQRTAARAAVTAILAETDDTTATIAYYHFVEGMDQGTIGRLVGLSRVSVNQRLARLRAQAQKGREAAT